MAPATGLVAGLLAIVVSTQGAADRPVLAALTLILGAVAGLLPYRHGLSLALGLACFEGFLNDFVGPRALYWNEIFAVVIVLRSLVVRRPRIGEAAAGGAIVAAFLGYLATGTSLKADAWGLKVLLTSAVVAWALARTRAVGAREWRVLYFTLTAIVGAAVVLAVWQRAKGVAGLQGLGLVYGPRIREVAGGGSVRAFGGFTSAAPFSYMLAITLCAGLAYALGTPRERRDALVTAWLPAAVAAGILLAVDRTAIVAALVAGAVLGATYRRRVLLPLVVALAIFGAAVVVTRGPGGTDGIGSTIRARTALWAEYLGDLRPLGHGPATAGSAYDKVDPPGWVVPLRPPGTWDIDYERVIVPRQALTVAQTRSSPRPPLTIAGTAIALNRPERLRVTLGYVLGGRRLADRRIPAARAALVRIRVPRGEGEAPLWFTSVPARPPWPRFSGEARRPDEKIPVLAASAAAMPALELRDLRVEGRPPARTPAERVWDQWFQDTPAALEGDGPGLVDNLYVSWLWQYGLLGVLLIAAWLTILLRPLLSRQKDSRLVLASLVGVFLAVAALAVSVWEESPTDLLAALAFASAFGRPREGFPTRSRSGNVGAR